MPKFNACEIIKKKIFSMVKLQVLLFKDLWKDMTDIPGFLKVYKIF